MSKLFGGSFWAGSMFKTSMLHGEEASVPGAGAGYWAGSLWKTAQFRTTMFRGLQVPSEGGGRYWSGSFWKTQQFATTFFAGEPVVVVPPVPAVSRASAGGGGTYSRGRHLAIRKEKRVFEDRAALAVALLEADELL